MKKETLEKFKIWCFSTGRSETTVANYLRYLEDIPNKLMKDPKKLNKWLYEQGTKPSVINQKIGAIKAYFDYVDHPEWKVFIKRTRWRADEKTRYLTPNQTKTYLEASETDEEKDVALTLLTTGIRESALLSITPNDIDKDRLQLQIKKDYKGNKMKKTYYCQLTHTLLIRLLDRIERHKIPPEQPIFHFHKNNGKPYTSQVDYLCYIIENKIGKKSKLPWVTPHILRHTFGTYHYHHPQKGRLNLLLTRNALGQKSGRATERYVHANREKDLIKDALKYFKLLEEKR